MIEDGRPRNKRLAVGIGRELSRQEWDGKAGALEWVSIPGWTVASFSVTSEGAAAIRIMLQVEALPEGVVIRFGDDSPRGGGVTVGRDGLLPRSALPFKPLDYWSPVVEGDTLRVDIFLPAGTDPAGFRGRVKTVSHLLFSPRTGTWALPVPQGRSAYCHIDVSCDDTGVPQALIDSTAMILFNDVAGNGFLCSGTLLNDTDTDTQIPYFLTANHCIENQAEASTIEYFWFYQKTGCGASQYTYQQQGGGAQFLAGGELPNTPDFTLLRMNVDPPAGVALSGWTTLPASQGDYVTGIHHPAGDVKKIAYATVSGFSTWFPGSEQAFTEVAWYKGITESGSSGSGLWVSMGGQLRLIGTLTGGSSSCSNRDGPDYYGRFDLAFAEMSPWLAPEGPPSGTVRLSGEVEFDGLAVCALVLINGEHQFSCDGEGRYELEVPRAPDGAVTVFAFADGFAPYSRTFVPYEGEVPFDISMSMPSDTRALDVEIDVLTKAGARATVAGRVLYDGLPVCALVLANGEKQFSCGGGGDFDLDVPLDGQNQVTLFVFADGFAPYKTTF